MCVTDFYNKVIVKAFVNALTMNILLTYNFKLYLIEQFQFIR